MSSTKYKAIRKTYWTSNGCDCCEATEHEYFIVLDEDGNEVITNGMPYSEENVMQSILENHGIEINFVYDEPETA